MTIYEWLARELAREVNVSLIDDDEVGLFIPQGLLPSQHGSLSIEGDETPVRGAA